MVAPTVDPQTLNGLVTSTFRSAETDKPFRAGSFARGEFAMGEYAGAMSLPQSAVLFVMGSPMCFHRMARQLKQTNRVTQIKVAVGRRKGEQIEIVTAFSRCTRRGEWRSFFGGWRPVRVWHRRRPLKQ